MTRVPDASYTSASLSSYDVAPKRSNSLIYGRPSSPGWPCGAPLVGHLDPTASYVEAAVSVAQAAKLFGTTLGRYYFNGASGFDAYVDSGNPSGIGTFA